jgi:hypothetical protein
MITRVRTLDITVLAPYQEKESVLSKDTGFQPLHSISEGP